MEIVYEYSCAGKAHQNEDIYGMNGNVVWVIDGATEMFYDYHISKDGDTLWIVQQINEALKRQDKKCGLSEMLFSAIQEVRKIAEEINPEIRKLAKYELPSFAICMAKIEKKTMKFLVLGDCSIMLKEKKKVIVDTRLEKFHKMVMDVKMKYTGTSLYKEKVREMAQNVRKHMNTFSGYWIGSLDENVAYQGITGELQLDRDEYILMCSDGFWPAIKENGFFCYKYEDIFVPEKIRDIIYEQSILEIEYEKRKGNNISDDKTVVIIYNA